MKHRKVMAAGGAVAAAVVAAAVVFGLPGGDAPGGPDPSGSGPPGASSTADPSAEPETGVYEPAAAARAVLVTWARPGLPYDQWWAALKPLLNAQGQQDYAATDPALIPELEITGPGRLEDAEVDTSAVVWFPTSAGRFGVRLSRQTSTHPWLMSRIYFPGTPDSSGAPA